MPRIKLTNAAKRQIKEARAKAAADKLAAKKAQRQEERKQLVWKMLNEPRDQQAEQWFQEYDAQHPDTWKAFCRVCRKLVHRSFKRWGVDGVFTILRYEGLVSTEDDNDDFLCDNNSRAFYSRKWLRENFTKHWDFFEIRQTPASHKPRQRMTARAVTA